MTRWRTSALSRRRRSHQRHGDRTAVGGRDSHAADIWCLPNEILIHIIRGMHIQDMIHLKPVHSRFSSLIDHHTSLWGDVLFTDVWPNKHNVHHFNKACQHNNIEALIKLGVAYLYNEGLPGDFEGKNITINGKRAAEMFCQVERRLSGVVPFTFVFIRPPWSPVSRGVCCKEYVYNNMKEYVKKHPIASIHQSIAQTMSLLNQDAAVVKEMTSHIAAAADMGSTHAKYMMWTHKYQNMVYPNNKEKIRELAAFTTCGNSLSARLKLCRAYVTGYYGNLGPKEAAAYVRQVIQTSKARHINDMFKFQELTHSMRYILLDWLVEVANMKDYCSLTLHLAITCVDRFLMKQRVTRAQLQLLGVSAMVLCSRFMGNEIITIREAAWLTDNTYKYEDVVRMMGEITASLRGNFRVVTTLDYTRIVSMCSECDGKTADRQCSVMCDYICELCLLHSDLGERTQGEIGCACVLLARILLNKEGLWSKKLVEYTGFTLSILSHVVMEIYTKCFSDGRMLDHRSVELEAVKNRYADLEYLSVSKVPVIEEPRLREVLELPQTDPVITSPTTTSAPDTPLPVITSPSRQEKKAANKSKRSAILSPSKVKNPTPILEKRKSSVSLNDSFLSGYLGDKEDEGDSLLLYDDDSDLDLDSLWCVDNINVSNAVADDEDNMSDNTRSHTPSTSIKVITFQDNLNNARSHNYQVNDNSNSQYIAHMSDNTRSHTPSVLICDKSPPSNQQMELSDVSDNTRLEGRRGPCKRKRLSRSRALSSCFGDVSDIVDENSNDTIISDNTFNKAVVDDENTIIDCPSNPPASDNASFSSLSSFGIIKCQEEMADISSPTTTVYSTLHNHDNNHVIKLDNQVESQDPNKGPFSSSNTHNANCSLSKSNRVIKSTNEIKDGLQDGMNTPNNHHCVLSNSSHVMNKLINENKGIDDHMCDSNAITPAKIGDENFSLTTMQIEDIKQKQDSPGCEKSDTTIAHSGISSDVNSDQLQEVVSTNASQDKLSEQVIDNKYLSSTNNGCIESSSAVPRHCDEQMHITPLCGTKYIEAGLTNSPVTPHSTLLPYNRSPMGGMSLFNIDTPKNTRFIQSGIKIDFSDYRKPTSKTAPTVMSTTMQTSFHNCTVNKSHRVEIDKISQVKCMKNGNDKNCDPNSRNDKDNFFVVKHQQNNMVKAIPSDDTINNTAFSIYCDGNNHNTKNQSISSEEINFKSCNNNNNLNTNNIDQISVLIAAGDFNENNVLKTQQHNFTGSRPMLRERDVNSRIGLNTTTTKKPPKKKKVPTATLR